MTMPPNAPGQPPQWSPPPSYPGAPYSPVPQARNGLGIAAMVTGIVGAVFGIIPFLFWLAGILGILALIFGLIGHGRARKGEATNKGMALTGIILGGLSIVLAIVWLVVVVLAVKDVADDIKKEVDKQEVTSSAAEETAPSDGSNPFDDSGDSGSDSVEPLKFGETHAYEDGVKVTIAKPASYKPDEFAIGHKDGNVAVQLKITIVNGSDRTIDIGTALPTAKDANGAESEGIFDGKQATRPFSGKLLPGKQAVSQFAFSVPADAAKELQVEFGPEVLEYEDAIWTGPAK
ncbi:DUF4190 domain-containing protein [Streptomyces sp. NBC_01142]|uniref:DUF4190 domain-containing protein n=1 Tax=Streptomyces sp. NBC_01142 TaxID=2975865 RepID=UPI0022527A1C|nr:DUF4190 domain-containing protein [Streptomyces sp. NBC_01142]MCX4822657.1 DUF4190 domain-containing protein [Streptomyces sp. NBC_01142]